MKKLPSLIFALLLGSGLLAQSSETIRQYIDRYKDIAIEEMHRTGVPASITLAQGIHETGAGKSWLVQKSNNHFGIKCKSDWKGESVTHDDDARGECFRKYNDPLESYRDHSDFLKNRSHYAFLFKLDPTDYEGWAHGLKKAGYATNPRYPQILIKLIRDYNLQDYTLLALEGKSGNTGVVLASQGASMESESAALAKQAVERGVVDYPSGTFKINGSRVTFVTQGTSYLKIADENDISLPRLFEYNDMKPADIAPRDELLYLQKKKKSGSATYHIVAPGETLHDIAQREGLRLEYLMKYNHLQEGMQPRAGEKLYLQEEAPSMPALLSDRTAGTGTADRQEEGSSTQVTHTVQPKETLYAIAKKYDVTVEELMQWNGLQATNLKVGQQLKIHIKRTHASQAAR